jgi:hypothetical protein
MSDTTESPTGDRLIAESEKAEDASRTERAANLFDLRRMIGGLFLVYGVFLTILGITASQKEIDKAAGVNVNLWTGLAMIVVAILFLIWAFARPMSKQLEEAEREREEWERERQSRGGGDGNGTGNGSTTAAQDDQAVGARAAT